MPKIKGLLSTKTADLRPNKSAIFGCLAALAILTMALTAIGRRYQTPANQSAGAQQQSADDAKHAEAKQALEERIRRAREILSTRDPNVTSRVSGITVISVRTRLDDPLFPNGAIYVKYRNDTGKTIGAFDERVSEHSFRSRDLIDPVADQTWHDRGMREEWYLIQPGVETEGVGILAAIFDDGSAAGAGEGIQAMREYRLGKKLVFSQAAALLEKALEGPDSGLTSAVDQIVAQQAAAGEEREQGLPIRADTSGERGVLVQTLQNMVQNPGTIGRRMFPNGQPAQFTLRTVLTEFTRRLSESADSM